MLKIALSLITLGILAACSVSNKELSYTAPENYFIDTISRTWNYDMTARYTGGGDLLAYRNDIWSLTNLCGANMLVFTNIAKDSVIELMLMNPDCGKVHPYMNEEGIYVILQDGRVLLYPHGSKYPSLKYNLLTDIPAFKESGLAPEWYKAGSDEKIRTENDWMYFRVNQNYDDSLGKYSNYMVGFPTTAKLNLKTKEVQFFGSMPKYVADGNYGHLSMLYDLYVGDSVIYSTPIHGNITVINTQSGKASTVKSSSDYQRGRVEKFEYKKDIPLTEQRGSKAEHSTYSAMYEPLFYNPYNDHYYRVFHPAMEKHSEDGLLNTEFNKFNILMIYNKDLKLIDEVVLPVRSGRTTKLWPVQNGVEFVISNSDLHTITNKSVTFKLLRITEK